MAIFRLTGDVVSLREKNGVSEKTQKPYSMKFATLRVNDFVRNEVLLSDELAATVQVGQQLELIVDVYTSGGYIRAQVQGLWPSEPAGRRSAA